MPRAARAILVLAPLWALEGCSAPVDHTTSPYDASPPAIHPCTIGPAADLASFCGEAGTSPPIPAGDAPPVVTDASTEDGGMEAGPLTDGGAPDAAVATDGETTDAGPPDATLPDGGPPPSGCPVTATTRVACAERVSIAALGLGGDGTRDAVLLASEGPNVEPFEQLATFASGELGSAVVLPDAPFAGFQEGAALAGGGGAWDIVLTRSLNGSELDVASGSGSTWSSATWRSASYLHLLAATPSPSGGFGALVSTTDTTEVALGAAGASPGFTTIASSSSDVGALTFDPQGHWHAAVSGPNGTLLASSAATWQLYPVGATASVLGVAARSDATVLALSTGYGAGVATGEIRTVFPNGSVRVAPLGYVDLPTACATWSLNVLSCGNCPVGTTCQAPEESQLTAAVARTGDGAVWLVTDSRTDVATYEVNADSSLGGLVCVCSADRGAVTRSQEWLTVAPVLPDGSIGRGFRTPVSGDPTTSSPFALSAEAHGTTLHVLRTGGLVPIELLVVDTTQIH